ncbi:MAG TPA: lysylphosphatidylglycerol synthase transmembrane domain-containing protein [Blastocatellia bacterium]|nr:lysylphosphatidylglycerol synthase transmembrane domain-containing protein [Blastocatellia bacterium]
MTDDRTAETTSATRRIRLRGIAQVIFGLAALALVFVKSDTRALLDTVRNTQLAYLPLAALGSFAVTWLMAARWGLILGVRPNRPPTARLFAHYLVGLFFTNFVPGGGVSGDVARLIYVDREIQDKPFVLSTLVYERLVGVFILLLIGVGATLGSGALGQSRRTIGLVEAVLIIAFVVSAALMSRRVTRFLSHVATLVGARLGLERFASALGRTLSAISQMKFHRGMMIGTLALSITIRVVWSLGCYVVARAMALPLPLITVFSFMSIVDLIRLLPISVGGLGVREWVMVALFASVGLSREQALSFSLLVFAPVYLNAIAGGLIYLARAGAVTRAEEGAKGRRGEGATGDLLTR